MSLTLKQEAFCQAYIENKGNASEAYRTAYAAGKMKAETVNKRASELMANGEITGRVAELQQEHRTKHDITVSDLLKELDEARQAALSAETPQASAAVAATMGKARLTGLDKVLIDLTADVKVENRSIKEIFDG